MFSTPTSGVARRDARWQAEEDRSVFFRTLTPQLAACVHTQTGVGDGVAVGHPHAAHLSCSRDVGYGRDWADSVRSAGEPVLRGQR